MSRIIFCGGKQIGYTILEKLLQKDEVVAIFSNPSDRLEGQWYPQVKTLAEKYKIKYHTGNINAISYHLENIDYLICAYYDRILSKKTICIPKIAAINIHLGLIDEYRGCYPTTFPIINGDSHAGITIHKMTEEIDNGLVYKQVLVPINNSDTGISVYMKCTQAASRAFQEHWDDIKDKDLIPYKINIEGAEYHKRDDFPSHELNISSPPDEIDRYVRALTFPPFPAPYIRIRSNKYILDYERQNMI